ncbi:FHA domain-containing protein [Streptomyces rubrolavendulae]|uniref:ABC transporter ATP-binding/permease protein n=2 Tax=Streptomyces TaxID=1883 RepID=A0A1D8FW56_9ACTN|nr:FHA domain-containing protein [Streptomyces rubrolavendulae]AOT57365.1 ABC transporter ATP-binding/permease protein [Streptomyces rubrolavendulae]
MGERPVVPTAPELVADVGGHTTVLRPGRVYRVGRDPASDIPVADGRVSWHHAVLRAEDGRWTVRDEDSTNGTYADGRRVAVRRVGAGTVLRFGHPADGPAAVLSAAPSGSGAPAGTDSGAPAGSAPAPAPPAEAPEPASASPPVQAPEPASAPPPVQAPEPASAPPPAEAPEAEAGAPGAAGAPAEAEPRAPGAAGPAPGGPQGPQAAAPRPSAVSHPDATGAFRRPTSVRPLPARTVRIGRASDNDVVVDDLVVSRHHAELVARPDGTYLVRDLGSHNGTFLNGRPVREARVGPEDVIGVGHRAYCVAAGRLVEYTDTGEVSLDVRDLAVTVDGGGRTRTLLDAVTFPVGERTLLGVVGPSGAGKSTLLNALTGLRPADRGTVLYDGRDLYRQYAELRQRIGLVPQDDILHQQLTVRRALGYAAELRFPEDTRKAERQARVDEVMRELGLEQRADQSVHSLSGGQRKRVSVALELLTKPSLLFLDEPTSGLDPGMDRSVMHMLRGLADDGRTVVVVTHSVLSLDVCDRLLVLAPGGRIAYYGPPGEALAFFGCAQWPEAFEAFENDRERDWAGRYRASAYHERYIEAAMRRPVEPAPGAAPAPPPPPPPKAQSWGSQLRTLVRRYAAALSADRTFLAIMVALPFVMGAMARALSEGSLEGESTLNVLLILCVGGVLTGAANAVREIVKERTIYRRERAVGLSRSAYLMSKVVVLGLVTVVQAVVLTLVALAGVPMNVPDGRGVLLPPLAEVAVAVAALSFTAMMLGLFVSALVRREEVTMPLLVLLAIVQVVFCGALLSVRGTPVLEQIAWLVPSRWAFAAMASTVDLGATVRGERSDDPLFAHDVSTWLLDMGALLALAVVLGFAVARLLRRHEPVIMRK